VSLSTSAWPSGSGRSNPSRSPPSSTALASEPSCSSPLRPTRTTMATIGLGSLGTPSSTEWPGATPSPSSRRAGRASVTTAPRARPPPRTSSTPRSSGCSSRAGRRPPDVDLRRRRLHGSTRQGRQGARVPRHRVRRTRDLRDPARFPMADEVRVTWPGPMFEERGGSLGPRDAVCILTHDPKFDVPAVRARTGHAGRLHRRDGQPDHAREADERLAEVGVTSGDELERLMSPIGLDIGARTPEETAISICAEIIARRTGRSAPSLRDGHGAIHS
jgi:xanthine/CO dehydrogenase XdhC/CoxF family maturation factor